jgi:hypothetical protein
MKTTIVIALLACGVLSAGCHDPSNYALTDEQVKSILTLEVVGPAAIPADGFTSTTLRARIHPENANNRTLFITTDRGTLVKGEGKLTDGALTVTAGPDGSVDFDLKSSNELGVATLVVTADKQPLISASTTVSFEAANPDDTVRFIEVPAEMPADGASQATISVQVNTLIPAPSRQAVFESTLGTLLPSSKIAVADAAGIARITLQSPTTMGSSRISVTTESVLRQSAVEFVRALPMTISAATAPITVTATAASAVEVTGQLGRTPGTVSTGTAVLFEAFRTDTGGPIGTFRNTTSSSTDQRVSGSFLPGPTDYRGDVELRISLPDRSVTGSTLIRVVAP